MTRIKGKFAKLLVVILAMLGIFLSIGSHKAYAMPFYDLSPQKLCLRAEFSTTFANSSAERKSNIALATRSIDKYFLDVNGEFSFNRVVGARTQKRGYKTAKIIVGGKFIDGVGGGVCQVSTTLYNAVLLAGLKITEYHPHSLAVSYIEPSFDAMVNSNSADLRFENITRNPIIIYATATETMVKFSIYGEPMKEKFVRESIVKEYISPPEDEIIIDTKNEYPDLYEGEKQVLTYPKEGLISQANLLKVKNGKVVKIKEIRKDKYAPIRRVLIIGTSPRPEESENMPIENKN